MRIASFLLFLVTAFSQESQKTPETTINVQVRRVTVDLIATDSHGKPVTDLKAEDIVLLENGVPQKLASFDRVDAAKTHRPAFGALPAGFLANNLAVDDDSLDLTVILFDELNTAFADAAYGRYRLEKLLRAPGMSGSPTSLLLLNRDLVRLHDFTSDPLQLLAAFKWHRPFLPVLADDEFPELMPATSDSFSAGPSPLASDAEKHYQEVFGKFNALSRVEKTLAALRLIGRSLGDRPGRKRLIWLSSGFPIAFSEQSGQLVNMSGLRTEDQGIKKSLRLTSTLLTRARVSVYPIDVRGVALDPFVGKQRVFYPQANQAAMIELAEQTGGRAYRGRNDLDRVAQEAMEDGEVYYAITYRPNDAQEPSRFRKIEVKTKRDDLRLRYRRGYFPADPETDPDKREFSSVAQEPLLRNEVAFAARATRTAPNKAHVTFFLPARSLRLPAKVSAVSRTFEVAAIEGVGSGQAYMGAPQTVTLSIDEAHFLQVARGMVPFNIDLPVAGKSGRLRLVVRDTETNRFGSLDLPLPLTAR